jgi:hypothetical protein
MSGLSAAGAGIGGDWGSKLWEEIGGAKAQQDAQAAVDALKQVEAQEKQTGDAAKEAGHAMSEFGGALGESTRGLVELVEKLGLALGAYELIKESLGAFSQAQDIQTSFSLLSGSAQTAADAMGHLKEMANQLGISEEAMLTTAQRLAPQFGVGTKAMDDALTASANAAAITGRSFDAVAASILRIQETGQVGKRQLDQLAISIQDVATTMGKTVEEATERLKAGHQDASKDVEIIIATLQRRYPEAAEEIAKGLKGQFTVLKNELHQLAEDMGAALAPVAEDLIGIAKTDIVPFVKDVVAAFQALPEPVRNAAIELTALAAAIKVTGARVDFASGPRNCRRCCCRRVGDIQTCVGCIQPDAPVDAATD